jgi:hypothetical protein
MWWTPSAVTALLFASAVQSATLFRSSHDSNDHVHRAISQREISDKCKISVKTNIWSTCGKLIDIYNATLPDFYYMNPDVEADCSQFHPGQTYCLRFSKIIHRCLRMRVNRGTSVKLLHLERRKVRS